MTIIINGHCWRSRIAIMRGRYPIGLSNANRQAAGMKLSAALNQVKPGFHLVRAR